MLECQKDALDAFNLLFDRYKKRIYNFSIRILGEEQAAEEITLDTFMRAYRSRGRYKPTARSHNHELLRRVTYSEIAAILKCSLGSVGIVCRKSGDFC